MSDHKSGTAGPICLKFLLGNLRGPLKCSEPGFESESTPIGK